MPKSTSSVLATNAMYTIELAVHNDSVRIAVTVGQVMKFLRCWLYGSEGRRATDHGQNRTNSPTHIEFSISLCQCVLGPSQHIKRCTQRPTPRSMTIEVHKDRAAAAQFDYDLCMEHFERFLFWVQRGGASFSDLSQFSFKSWETLGPLQNRQTANSK